MALDLQNLKNKITSAKDIFANALFGVPTEVEQPDGNVEYIYNTQRQTDFMQGLPSNKDLLGKIQASPYSQGYTDEEIINRVAQGQNFGLPELANEQREWGIKLPRANNELDEEAVRGNYLNVYQPKLQTGATTTPRQGGFFNDLAKGYEENLTQKFDFQNLAPDKNKSFATRLGEGAGSLVSFYNKPIARGLLGAAAALALGGGAGGALAMGLGTTVARQRNMTKDSAYRQNLQQMGYTQDEIDAIPGIISDNIYSNLIRAQQLKDNAEYRNMLLENQQANTAAQLEYQRMQDVYDRAQKEREFNYRASQDAFDNYIASENLKAKQKEGEASSSNIGDTTFQQIQLLEDAFSNMPQSQAAYGKKAKAVLTGATNLVGLRNDNVTAYEAIRNPLVTTLARSLAGEKGVLTDKDFARAEKMVPTAFDSPEQAQAKFEQIKKLVGVKYGNTPNISQSVSTQTGKYKEGQTATNPKTGAKMIYRGGTWQAL